MRRQKRADNQDKPRRTWLKRGLWLSAAVLAALVVALVALRLALPSILRSHINQTLDQSPDYDGSIGDITVSLWRGKYTIHDIKIVKRNHSVPVPFFTCPTLDIALDTQALLHARFRGTVDMTRPTLHFVDAPTEAGVQTGADQPWLAMLNNISPFQIDKAVISGGEIHFHAFHKDPPVNVYLSDVQCTISNLTNIKRTTDPLVASVRANAQAMGDARLKFALDFDPESHFPTFTLALRLLNLDVRKLNNLARAYGDFDFESGQFDFVVEATAKDGSISGYAKPLFRNVKVLSLRDIKDKNPLEVLWEAMIAIVGTVFENQSRQQFATRIPIEGDLNNPQTSILQVIGNVLRNAFVRAYLPRIEHGVKPVPPEQRSPKPSQ